MSTSEDLFAEAADLRRRATEIEARAADVRREELRARPVADRLVYSAYARCPCGAGLAYDPVPPGDGSPFKGILAGAWDCASVLLGTADLRVRHTAVLPFSLFSILAEGQPSANGLTTRPCPPPQPPRTPV